MAGQLPDIKTLSADIIIVGGGPAGLAAGIYASRAGKKTIVLQGRTSSRLSIGYTIENYPGFISINSQDLLEKFKGHAEHFGAQVITGDAIDYNLTSDPKYVTTRDTLIGAKAVILAPGRTLPRTKIIPGEERLLGMGVSYCATCDGPLYRGSRVAALGNSDEAAEDILLLEQMGCEVKSTGSAAMNRTGRCRRRFLLRSKPKRFPAIQEQRSKKLSENSGLRGSLPIGKERRRSSKSQVFLSSGIAPQLLFSAKPESKSTISNVSKWTGSRRRT